MSYLQFSHIQFHVNEIHLDFYASSWEVCNADQLDNVQPNGYHLTSNCWNHQQEGDHNSFEDSTYLPCQFLTQNKNKSVQNFNFHLFFK